MRRLSAVALLVLATAVLAGVWRFQAPATPPLYDGVCTAPAYVGPSSSPAPQAASKSYQPAKPGDFPTSEIVTGEDVPQAQVLMTDGTFVSTEPFTVSITPVPPPSVAPAGGRVDGNAYRFAAVTQSGTQLQPIDAGHPLTILLRATSSSPARIIERFDGSTWTPLKTILLGCGDTFETVSPRLGVFAAVVPNTATTVPSNNGSGGGLPLVPLVAGGTALVLIVVLGLLRLVRGRAR